MTVTFWEPGTAYSHGDIVEYEGHHYKIIQPHRSQGDWTPPVTPALWGRCQDGQYQTQQGQQTQGQQILAQAPSYNNNPNKQPGGSGNDDKHDSDSDTDDEGQNKANEGWLTEKKKNALLIGGGIAAVGVLGAGVFAYSKHKSKKEERAKQEAWRENANPETWQAGAVARTRSAEQGQQKLPVYWIFTEGQNIPRNAIYGGRESSGQNLYIARSFKEGGLHPGKAGEHLQGGSSISWGGQEVTEDKHEILVGDENAVEWVTLSGRSEVAIEKTGKTPVEGGREKDGTFLFVARVKHDGAIIPGKVHEDEDFASYGFGGQEQKSNEFQVLFYR